MAYSLREVSCGSGASGNVGFTNCDVTLYAPIGFLAVPNGAAFTDASLSSATTAYNYAISQEQAVLNANRWFVLGKFEGIESNGQAPQEYTSPSGNRMIIRDATSSFRYELPTKMCYYRQIKKKSWAGYSFFEICPTSSGEIVLVGVGRQNATTQREDFIGIPTSFVYVENPGRTQNEPERYFMQIQYEDATDAIVNRAIFKLDASWLSTLQIPAVKDVFLNNRTPNGAGAGIFTIKPEISCGGQSLAELVPAVISATYWDVKNATTGNAITITTVAAGAGDLADHLVFTLDTTDTDYPTSGNTLSISLKGLGTILAVVGAYESIPVIIKIA